MEGTFCSLPVAVKVFSNNHGIDPSCLNELQVLRHLHHPNIVIFLGACVDRIHDAATEGRTYFDLKLVLERVEGMTLS
eukprot:1514059-Heterocapsa_arctica.AAC.1